jgi:TolB protein
MTLTNANPYTARQLAALALVVLALAALSPSPARAVVELNITQGTIQPLPIAIPDFAGDGSVDPEIAREVSNVVTNDLRSSGLFIPIDQAAFIEKGVGLDSLPRFEDWRVVNAQALAVGRIGASDGKLRAEFRLWTCSGTQLAGEQFFARPRMRAASATSSPTPSTSGSRVRRAISIPASCSSTSRAPRTSG